MIGASIEKLRKDERIITRVRAAAGRAVVVVVVDRTLV
jgi:hypothetical protein